MDQSRACSVLWLILQALSVYEVNGNCAEAEVDSELNVVVNCTYSPEIIHYFISVKYDRVFTGFLLSHQCKGHNVNHTRVGFGEVMETNYSLAVFHEGPCVFFGCVQRPEKPPFPNPLRIQNITCSRRTPPPPVASETPATLESMKTSDLVIARTVAPSETDETRSPSAMVEASVADPQGQVDSKEKGRIPLLVILTPVLVVGVAVLLLGSILWIVWGVGWRNRKYSRYHREFVNKMFGEHNHNEGNDDDSFIFNRAVVPILQHSNSTLTLLEGLKYESNSSTVTPNGEGKDNCIDSNAISDIGYVNDGLHPLNVKFKGNNKKEGVASTIATDCAGQFQRTSSDDVLLPNAANVPVNSYVLDSGSKEKVGDSTRGKGVQKVEVGCSSEGSACNEQLKGKGQSGGSPATSHRGEQIYIDYDKIIKFSAGKECGRTDPQRRATDGLQKNSATVTYRLKNSYLEESDDAAVLLMDTPFHDDSGFKSNGDTMSIVSV